MPDRVSGTTNLTNDANIDNQPDWQRAPGPINGLQNKLDLGLVPAYKQCGTGGNPSNATHGAPMSSASCVPSRLSGTARFGPAAHLHALIWLVRA